MFLLNGRQIQNPVLPTFSFSVSCYMFFNPLLLKNAVNTLFGSKSFKILLFSTNVLHFPDDVPMRIIKHKLPIPAET